MYALEGSIFVAGAVQWLRDEAGLIKPQMKVKSWQCGTGYGEYHGSRHRAGSTFGTCARGTFGIRGLTNHIVRAVWDPSPINP